MRRSITCETMALFEAAAPFARQRPSFQAPEPTVSRNALLPQRNAAPYENSVAFLAKGSFPMANTIHARVGEVTERIVKRSHDRRRVYLERIDHAIGKGPARKKLGCANFAHGFAACGPEDKH